MGKSNEKGESQNETTSSGKIREAKQVIVMRKDLNMRRGKMVAQGAHASLGAILMMQEYRRNFPDGFKSWTGPFDEWIGGQFSKICVSVDSGEELLRIYSEAQDAGLPVKLITDSGKTEFHGVPTLTCLAIGPCWVDDVNAITGGLRLL